MDAIFNKKKVLLSVFLGLILSFILCVGSASAAVSQQLTIPTSTRYPASSATYINLGQSTATKYTINPSYSSYFYMTSGSPKSLVLRKQGGGRTFTNPFSIEFANVGEINGRQLNAKLNVDTLYLILKSGYSYSTEITTDGRVLDFWSSETQFASFKVNNSYKYRGQHRADMTLTITYADTGEVVDLPLYQIVWDLDTYQNCATIGESFFPTSGYDKAYIYQNCNLSAGSGGYWSPGQSAVDGDASFTQRGLIATTGNGKITWRQDVCNAVTGIQLCCQYTNSALKPTLEIDNSKVYKSGENVVLNVKQKIGKFYVDTMSTYTNLSLEDDIPDGLTYKNAKVVNNAGKDVTSMGSLTYDESTKTVKFAFNSSALSPISFYNGDTYTLEITTVADPLETEVKTITDTAKTTISGLVQTTNSATARIKPNFSLRECVAIDQYFHIDDEVTEEQLGEEVSYVLYNNATDSPVTDQTVLDSCKFKLKEVKNSEGELVAFEKYLPTAKKEKYRVKYCVEVGVTDDELTDEKLANNVSIIKDLKDSERERPDSSSGSDTPESVKSDIRYISKDYISTLDDTSKWATDSALNSELTASLNKKATDANAVYVIELSKEDCDDIKAYVCNEKKWDNSLNKEVFERYSYIFTKK